MPGRRREFIVQVNQISDALLIAVVFWLAHAVREQLAYLFPFPFLFHGHVTEFVMIAPFRYYKWLYLVILPLYPGMPEEDQDYVVNALKKACQG